MEKTINGCIVTMVFVWLLCTFGGCSVAAGYSMLIVLSLLAYISLGRLARLTKRVVLAISGCLGVVLATSSIDVVMEGINDKIKTSSIISLIVVILSVIVFCISLAIYASQDQAQDHELPDEDKPIVRVPMHMHYAAAASTA